MFKAMRPLASATAFAVLAGSAAVLAGCIVDHPESAVAHCTRVETADSARAACIALDTIFRVTKRRPVAIEIKKEPAGFVVRTIPGDTNMVDAMARVTVNPALRVVAIAWGDSL